MSINTVQHGKHYCIRLRFGLATARVDAVHPDRQADLPYADRIDRQTVLVYVCEVGSWRWLAPSDLLYEVPSPQQAEAIQAKRDSDSRRQWIRREAAERARLAALPVFDESVGVRRKNRDHQFTRQGTLIHYGDFGISRE